MFKAFWDFTVGTVPEVARLAVWRVVIVLLLSGHIAWACGWLPGLSGFAMAADVMANTDKLSAIEKSVVCNAVIGDIKRYRSELRDNETKMIEAQQVANQALITHLSAVLNDIRDLISDEVVKRNANKCSLN